MGGALCGLLSGGFSLCHNSGPGGRRAGERVCSFPSPALKFAGAALDSWQDPRSRLTAYLMV